VTLLFVPNDGGDDTAGVGDTTIRPAARAASQPPVGVGLHPFGSNNVDMAPRVAISVLLFSLGLALSSKAAERAGFLQSPGWRDPAEKSLEGEVKSNTIITKSVQMSESFSPDVPMEFKPELPNEPGGVWDFDAAMNSEDGTFASVSGPDPMVMPLGLVAGSRTVVRDYIN